MLPVPVISMVPRLVIAPPDSATPLSFSVSLPSTWIVPVSVIAPPVTVVPSRVSDHAAVDRQLGITQHSVDNVTVTGDLDRTEIGDRRVGQFGRIQGQRRVGIDNELTAVQQRAVDGAVAGDLDGAFVCYPTTGDRRTVQRQCTGCGDRDRARKKSWIVRYCGAARTFRERTL